VTAILLVDDEPAIRESLAFALRRDGFDVEQAASLREARNLTDAAELVILDLVLPDGNGLEFLRALRSRSDVPVIVLTSRDEETDRVVGLELGADDYVIKPFSPREVAARVRAVLRRASKAAPPEEQPVRAGALSLDASTRKAAIADRELCSPAPSSTSSRCSCAARAGSSSAARSSTRSGAAKWWSATGRWTSTSRRCAGRSRRLAAIPHAGDGARGGVPSARRWVGRSFCSRSRCCSSSDWARRRRD